MILIKYMYNLDFINRVIKVYKNRKKYVLSVNNIADIFGISKSTIYNWINDKHVIIDNVRIYNKSLINDDNNKIYYNYIINYVDNCTHFNIKNLLRNLFDLFKKGVSKAYIYNVLKKHNYTHKKIQTNKYPHPNEKLQADINTLCESLKRRKKRIISLDEVSIELLIPHKYGWSKKGERCIKKISNKRIRFSMVMAISRKRMIGFKIVEGSFNRILFNEFMDTIVKPNTNYMFLMDNAKIHRNKIMKKEIKDKIIYNVPYCPQYNPIEYVFNVLKKEIKDVNLKDINDLKKFMENDCKQIFKKGFDNYFDKSFNNLNI